MSKCLEKIIFPIVDTKVQDTKNEDIQNVRNVQKCRLKKNIVYYTVLKGRKEISKRKLSYL